MAASRLISCVRGRRRRAWGRVLGSCVGVVVLAAGGTVAQAVAVAADRALAAPGLADPRLLTPGEVLQGVRLRLEALQDAAARRRERLMEDGAGDPWMPDGAVEGPLPPDVPGGEIEREQSGGGE
jgi:hypothetical protein